MDSNIVTACIVGVSVSLVYYIIKLSLSDNQNIPNHDKVINITKPEDLISDDEVLMFKNYLIDYFDQQDN